MRPGIDQLPGTNMEYYIADEGLVYRTKDQTILVNTFDTPLLYMGEMESHPILLCDNKEENNKRPVYSWIMNNTWETNFKMDRPLDIRRNSAPILQRQTGNPQQLPLSTIRSFRISPISANVIREPERLLPAVS